MRLSKGNLKYIMILLQGILLMYTHYTRKYSSVEINTSQGESDVHEFCLHFYKRGNKHKESYPRRNKHKESVHLVIALIIICNENFY